MESDSSDKQTCTSETPLYNSDRIDYKDLFYRAFEVTPILMAISSIEDGVFVDVNRSWLDTLGYRKDEIVGRSSKELNVFADFQERDNVKQLIIENGTVRNQLVQFVTKSGETRFGQFSGDIINLDGKEYILTTAYDITENMQFKELEKKNRRLKQQLEYDKMKAGFLANISHELKTPINIIFSSLQLFKIILDKESLEDIRSGINKHADIMMQNCYRMIRLVNNLIDVTRAGSGYLKLNLANYDIVDELRKIMLSVTEYSKYNSIDISFSSEYESISIACDIEKIERIVLNLFSNAIKFTPQNGYIYVDISIRGDKVLISIKDTGIGIPKSKQKFLFRRFYQVNSTLARPSEGSGIGLSLSKSLAVLHNGDLYLNKDYDAGCDFILELPLYTVKRGKSSRLADLAHINNSHLEMIKVEFSDIYFDDRK